MNTWVKSALTHADLYVLPMITGWTGRFLENATLCHVIAISPVPDGPLGSPDLRLGTSLHYPAFEWTAGGAAPAAWPAPGC